MSPPIIFTKMWGHRFVFEIKEFKDQNLGVCRWFCCCYGDPLRHNNQWNFFKNNWCYIWYHNIALLWVNNSNKRVFWNCPNRAALSHFIWTHPQWKTCPFIRNAEKNSVPKQSVKITDRFTCTSANVIYNRITRTYCKKLYMGKTRRRLGDRFQKHVRI